MINHYKNDINKIAVKYSSYAIVAQWQSTSLVMKRSGVQFPSIACVSNDENKKKGPPAKCACTILLVVLFSYSRRTATSESDN